MQQAPLSIFVATVCLFGAAFVPSVLGKASCQVTCTGDMTTGSCATSVTSYKIAGCEGNGATFTQVTNKIFTCYGNLGCSDAGSISACAGVAAGITNCGTCTSAMTDCESTKCFPANATVQLQDGSLKTMAELEVGNAVHVGAGAYSPVFMFSHRMTAAESQSQFVAITTSVGTLQLTAGHYLFVNGVLTAAGSVRVGDHVETGAGKAEVVQSVELVWGKGLYNPHTMTGDIVVDGIKTSCYTTAIHPTLAHAALFPVRALYSAGVDVVNHAFDQGSDLIAKVMPDGPESL